MSPNKQNLHGFEKFDINEDFKQKSSSENVIDTNRTTDSLDVFPTTYFNTQLQEIENNMKILSSDTQNSKKINLNNENA